MRRVVLIALLGVAAWLFVRSRRDGVTVSVGWDDGSHLTLDRGSPEHARFVATARSVVGR